MKVGIVADTIYNWTSGLSVFTKRLIEQLEPHVDKVVVITGGRKKEIITKGGRKIYAFSSLNPKVLKKFPVPLFSLASIKKAIVGERLDVIHLQTPSPMCVIALFYAKLRSVPVVVTSHTQPDNILTNFNITSKSLRKLMYKYFIWVYNKADYVVCPSEHGRKELMEHGTFRLKHSRVISNGIDAKTFRPGKKKKNILFVGRVMKEKNIDTLIRASAIVKKVYPGYKFIVVGDGYLKDELQNLSSKINPSIVFTGKVSDKELVDYYRSASVFVLPSESELQGIVLLEAMACGVPTIASDSKNSAASELANILFKNRDYRDLADKIIGLLGSPDEMERLSKKNRETILLEHDFPKIISQYMDTYKKVIAMKKSGNRIKRPMKKLTIASSIGFISSKYFDKQHPLWIDLRVTSRCNLRCVYCDIPNSKIGEMSTEEIKMVIDKIDKETWFLITGGEPLMRKDIKDIIDHIVFNSPHKAMLNTNLTLLPQRYEEVKNADGFYFSLDGAKETHEKNKGKGTWDKVIAALEILHKEKRAKISMTVITDNTTMQDIKEVLGLCKKYDIIPAFQSVRHYSMSGSSKVHSPDKDRVKKIFDYLIRERKEGFVMMNSVKGLIAQKRIMEGRFDKNCYSGRLFCSIDSDGVLGLCFSRPRSKKFLNLSDKDVSYDKALKALLLERPAKKRCCSCTCMAPIEFALCGMQNLDAVMQNDESFSRLIRKENRFIKRDKKRFC
jgi:glycosyltransferase involved in cell wall biosynthesis/MoaA/NifB/PqqE/SkfB family radical SAM enzyme